MGGLVLNVFVEMSNMFLLLAGRTAEVQTGLHQPFPGQSARAGAKGTGEEGAGGLCGSCCSRPEESPKCPVYLSERYCASSHSHLSHPLYPLSHCSCSGCLPHDQSHKCRHRTKGDRFQPLCAVHTNICGFKLLISNIFAQFYIIFTFIFFLEEVLKQCDPPQLLNDRQTPY